MTDDALVWFARQAETLGFARVLVAAELLDTPEAVLDFFEKPYRYDPEHQIWDVCRRPTSGSIGWNWFIRKLEQEGHL